MLQAVFWQSLNQSHNACVNFANRNATSPVTAFGAFQGWMGAVATSVPIALGLGIIFNVLPQIHPLKITVHHRATCEDVKIGY